MPKRVAEVLRYFLRNPAAADSLHGVAHWRLREEVVHRSVEETSAALRWLVGRGFLGEGSAAGANSIFYLVPERAKSAEMFVAEIESGSNEEPIDG